MHDGAVASRRIALGSGLLTLTLLWAWAAAEAPHGALVLWSGNDQWVRIERQDNPDASPNDHPAPLDAAKVANALGALRIRVADPDTGAETQRAVFTREELGNLAPPVAAGLAKAGPREDVTFTTIGSHALGGLVKDLRVNSGRIFYEDGKVNVIFGELQGDYRKKNVYGQRTEDFDPRRQGAREQASKQKWALDTSPGIALHATGDNRLRSDWVTIDPEITMKVESQAVVASSARPDDADPKLEHRLQALKDLKSKGLISEDAYNAKVQELLSEL